MNHQVDIVIGQTSVQSSVKIDGVDISPLVRSVTIECAAGEGLTRVTLGLQGARVRTLVQGELPVTVQKLLTEGEESLG